MAADIAAHAAGVIGGQRLTAAVAVGYGHQTLVTPLADVLRDAFPQPGIDLRDFLRVQDGRYWSYLCGDEASRARGFACLGEVSLASGDGACRDTCHLPAPLTVQPSGTARRLRQAVAGQGAGPARGVGQPVAAGHLPDEVGRVGPGYPGGDVQRPG
jgi:hypothetical protein